MASVSKSIATLRIAGDELDPQEITRKLGADPTFSVPKNGLHSRPKGKIRIARTGIWRLGTEYPEPADLDGQVHEIFGKLTSDLDVWKEVGKALKIDIFCGLWLSDWNEGVSLSPLSLSLLGARGVRL